MGFVYTVQVQLAVCTSIWETALLVAGAWGV